MAKLSKSLFLVIALLVVANAVTHGQVAVRTGTRIPASSASDLGDDEISAAPLDTITSTDISRVNDRDLLIILQKREPDVIGAGNIGPTNANISAGQTLGGSTVQLRGLPTLVLYNGRRVADSPAIATGGAQFTDISLFPAALISRIEVLKDSASALYGSDAIGGVVNIFMKEAYEGVEIGARYGFSVESGVAERGGYAIAGTGNGTTHVTVGLQYLERDALFQRERGYSTIPGTQGATITFGGAGRDSSGFYLIKGMDPTIGLPNGLNSPFDVPGVVPGGATSYRDIPQAYDQVPQSVILGFNLSTQRTSTLDLANTSAYSSFSHQIFGRQLELFGDFLYTRNHSTSYQNAQPLSNATGVVIPAGHVGTDLDLNSATYDPTIWNPFNRQIDASTATAGPRRLMAANRYQSNPRIFTNDSNFYRILGGLGSQITPGWMAEAAASYSHYTIDYVNRNLVRLDVLNAMIAGFDIAGDPIPSVDFFAQNPIGTNPGQASAAQFSTIFGNNIRKFDTFQETFDAKIVGSPFSLPGGNVGISLGGEYREEGFRVNDSPEIFVGSVPIQELNLSRSAYAFFAEANVPIVGRDQHIPLVHGLELNLAGRYDHYKGIGEEAASPRVTLRYQTFDDLTLRGSWSNSFEVPNLYETGGPQEEGFLESLFISHPGVDTAQILTGSNPDLRLSKAETFTAGLVFRPRFLPGFTLTADYFRILQRRIVGVIGASAILDSVNALGPASPYADFVAFHNFPGRPGSQPVTAADFSSVGYLSNGLGDVFVDDRLHNSGAARAEGFDLSAHYDFDLHQCGRLELGANAVVFTTNDRKRNPTSHSYSISQYDFPEYRGANPDYKLTFLFAYYWRGATLSLNAQYIPELKKSFFDDPEFANPSEFTTIEDYFTLDGRLSHTFKGYSDSVVDARDGKSMNNGKDAVAATAAAAATMSPIQKLVDGLTVTIGCNNIFDEDPRLVIGASNATDLSIYDPYGRFVYLEVSKKF
jgi:iron complex outermembrane receptor protein